jgi:hypothetical protein
VPIYVYKTKNREGQNEERSFHLREFRLDECPVSVLTTNRGGKGAISGPRAVRLVKLWQKAERQHTTLTALLGSHEAWIEDVEDLLSGAQEQVKATFEIEREKRGG